MATVKIVLEDYNPNNGGSSQGVLLHLIQRDSGNWTWHHRVGGALGTGERSGWVTVVKSGSLPVRFDLEQFVSPGHGHTAAMLSTSAFPPKAKDSGYGDHKITGGNSGGFPAGRVAGKVVA